MSKDKDTDTDNTESFEEFKSNLDTDKTAVDKTTEPVTEEATTEPNVSDTAVDNSETTEESAPAKNWEEEHSKTQKSYDELQNVFGKQGTELGELRRFKKDFEPYLGYLQQVAEQQKQASYEEDPDLKYKDMLNKELQPFREQQVEYEATKTMSAIETELGSNYDKLAPVMANVLKYYRENDPEVAEYLARNPVVLIRQAAGDLFFHEQSQTKSQTEQTKQTRQQQVKSMSGTAKSSVAGKTTKGDMSSMSADEMRDHLRKLGIAQKID